MTCSSNADTSGAFTSLLGRCHFLETLKSSLCARTTLYVQIVRHSLSQPSRQAKTYPACKLCVLRLRTCVLPSPPSQAVACCIPGCPEHVRRKTVRACSSSPANRRGWKGCKHVAVPMICITPDSSCSLSCPNPKVWRFLVASTSFKEAETSSTTKQPPFWTGKTSRQQRQQVAHTARMRWRKLATTMDRRDRAPKF